MASPPSPDMSALHLSKTRSRSSTGTSLPDASDPSSHSDLPPPPKPEKHTSSYTNERLSQSLEYCRKFLHRRNMSPRSELFMNTFKEEITCAMKAETQEQKLAGAGAIRVTEFLIQRNAFLQVQTFNKSQELQRNLLEPRELQYLSRYGDYVKIIPSRIRAYASHNQTEGWQLLCSRFIWSEIADRLAREMDEMDTRLRTEGAAALGRLELDTHTAVTIACKDLGISDTIAIWSIVEYGKRNQAFHRDFEILRDSGEWQKFADVLYTDLDDVDCVFSEVRPETDKSALKSIICEIIDMNFDRTKSPDQPRAWIPKEELIDAYVKASKEKGKVPKAGQKTINIAEQERKREEKATRSETMVSGSSQSKKRIASTEEPRGSEEDRLRRDKERRRVIVVHQCKLEKQLERLQAELAKLDKP